MTDLFSNFDGCNMLIYNSSILTLLPALMIFMLWGVVVESVPHSMMLFFMQVASKLYYRSKNVVVAGFFSKIMGVLLCVLSLNFYGLIPLSYSLTSQIFITMSVAIPMWMSLALSSLSCGFKFMASSFLPVGTPDYLVFFVTCTEVVSYFLRAITLSLRLFVNVMAGHVLLHLISSGLIVYLMNWGLFSSGFWLILIIGVMYFLFEIGINFLQGGILVFLMLLYSTEHPPKEEKDLDKFESETEEVVFSMSNIKEGVVFFLSFFAVFSVC